MLTKAKFLPGVINIGLQGVELGNSSKSNVTPTVFFLWETLHVGKACPKDKRCRSILDRFGYIVNPQSLKPLHQLNRDTIGLL